MTQRQSRSLTYLFVTYLFVTVSVGSTNLSAQQTESEDKKQDTTKIESQDVQGKITLNGKELEFSTLDVLEAITRGLREDTSKKTNEGKVLPNYFEMKAIDLTETKTFYGSAFGFKFLDYGKEYAAVVDGPIGIGFALGKEPSSPMPAFQTFDIAASLKTVKAANGKIEKGIFTFPGGRRFEFLDPSGNRIAVFQNN